MRLKTPSRGCALLLFSLLLVLLVGVVFAQNNNGGGGGGGGGGNGLRRGNGNGTNPARNLLRRQHRSKFPLRAEDLRRKSKRTSECRLGRNVHEIGDSWSPDLGEPFGIMHCITCACEPVQKKRRIVGRIRCKNMKSECPKVDCADAVSIPGQCCKICPQLLKNSVLEKGNSDSSDDTDSNENNNKEYAALLTPRTSSLIKSSTGLGEPMGAGVATGRFLFLHKSLYFSFVTSEALPHPKFIQFVDPEGNVVEEQEVALNAYQTQTHKICGVWRKIPRVYRKLLKDEKLFAALVTEKIGTDNDRFLAGRVAKQKYVATELYSSLLQPSSQVGTGGMAIITVSPSTGSIYLNVVFNGDFGEDRDIGLTLRLGSASGVGVEEMVTIPKVNYESNSIEVRSILELSQLNALSRGTLFIVLYSPKNPDFKLIGFIQARHSCDIFDTVLSPESENVDGGGLAMAWVYPLPDGSWAYNLEFPTPTDTQVIQPQRSLSEVSVKLETGRKVLEEVRMSMGNGTIHQVKGGMSPRYYQLLYEGNLYLNVVTEGSLASLRGRLTYRGFGDAQASDAPLLLQTNNNGGEKDKTQGLVWLGVDSDCAINYQLTLSQRPQSELLRLELVELPALQNKGLPVKSYTLDNFEASEHEGIFNDVSKMSFPHIKAGDATLKILRVNDSFTLASAPLRNIRVPSSCLPTIGDNSVINGGHPDYTLEPEDDSSASNPQGILASKCYHDGQLREEYSQWTPNNDTCSICNCHKGQATCEPVVCPKLSCVNPVLITGECCRSCLSERTPARQHPRPSVVGQGRGCNVEGDRFHPAGSTWHPYMPPNGFMICTTCACNSDTLSVECKREECPPLNCGSDEAIYPRALACCKICPPRKAIDPDTINDDVAQYERQERGPTEAEVLASGGCKFRDGLHKNGEEWNHRIEPFGNIPCVVCSCRSGDTKCGRKKCPPLHCDIKVKEEGECCPRCGTGPSTSDLIPRKGPAFLSHSGLAIGGRRKPLPSKQRQG